MKYTAEMGSCDMIYMSHFIEIGSGIQKLREGRYRKHSDCISLGLFFKIRNVG
jgi:hypothetical protein